MHTVLQRGHTNEKWQAIFCDDAKQEVFLLDLLTGWLHAQGREQLKVWRQHSGKKNRFTTQRDQKAFFLLKVNSIFYTFKGKRLIYIVVYDLLFNNHTSS